VDGYTFGANHRTSPISAKGVPVTVPERNALREQLMLNEGYRPKPYRCSAGKLTIGHGRNLEDVGIDSDEARYLLDKDITRCIADLSTFPWFEGLDAGRTRALLDMRFQLGPSGFRGFKKMIAALERNDFATAAREAADSKWASSDSPRRAAKNIVLLRDGSA
jgi:lysozyme